MALLDVVDVIVDPDFMDKGLIRERSVQSIDEDGFAYNHVSKLPFSAVVTQHRGDQLNRTKVGEHIEGSITVTTRTELRPGTEDYPADVIVWRGRRYTVTPSNDWSHFGRGFYQVNCDLIPMRG